MKQENRFVAQLFHYLAPFVDMERDLFICVDGGAAKYHASRDGSSLKDPDVPDLWFALVGKPDCFGIEAKIIEGNKISVRQSQLRAWRTEGTGYYCPKFWVASNRDLTEYYCWLHSTLVPCLNLSRNTTANVSLSVTKYTADYNSKSISELALYILNNA